MKLQGLPEATKFELLSDVVSESITVKEMAVEAERIKKLLVVLQREFITQMSLPSWEDAERMYSLHTRERVPSNPLQVIVLKWYVFFFRKRAEF